MNPVQPPDQPWDAVIIGGSLSGSATALLLLRAQPHLRLLIIEKTPVFTRRVGEATVEVSAHFLGHVLGLTQYLNQSHLIKQGMRFWFTNHHAHTLEDSSEIGGRYLARVPAYQVDRSTLDEEIIHRAQSIGAQLWRPATVQHIELHPGGEQILTIRRGEHLHTIKTRWIVDASGIAALISRQNHWLQPNHSHPTTAVWSRWRGVLDMDSHQLAIKYPRFATSCHGIRATATNHLMGDGWWAWIIPLKGGDVSIGVVFDQRRVTWPEHGTLGARLKDFLCHHPVARELLQHAHPLEGDVHWRKNLPYSSRICAGDGFVLVGDAAAFIDPLYSPGMDWIAYSSTAASELIQAQHRGEPLTQRIRQHNLDANNTYHRWFEALYRDKYDYLDDYELMRIAFLLDLGLYYLGVVSQPFKHGATAYRHSPFSQPMAIPFYRFMQLYNRRLAAMGRHRRKRGRFGRHNHGQRFMFGGYTLSPTSAWPIARAVLKWCLLELAEGWRTWLTPATPGKSTPTSPDTTPA